MIQPITSTQCLQNQQFGQEMAWMGGVMCVGDRTLSVYCVESIKRQATMARQGSKSAVGGSFFTEKKAALSDFGNGKRNHHIFHCTKPIHAGKNILGNSFLREYMRGLYRHSREYRKIIWRDHFPHISEMRIHVAPVFAPARIQEKIPVFALFMYWFRARGYSIARRSAT